VDLCRECDGVGHYVCNHCDGDGADRAGRLCRWCGGDGVRICPDCDGRGLVFEKTEVRSGKRQRNDRALSQRAEG
jgi:DnaJ-class molecular chaperone